MKHVKSIQGPILRKLNASLIIVRKIRSLMFEELVQHVSLELLQTMSKIVVFNKDSKQDKLVVQIPIEVTLVDPGN